jgi:thiol-disulfide isomerase/thioredoxin
MKFLPLILTLALSPVAAFADPDLTQLNALREGHMKKLVFHETPVASSAAAFTREDGSQGHLSDYEGQIVLLNFWATWCAPCRNEMPGLDRLQTELGGADFQVVTLATGRNNPAGIDRFFDSENITALPKHNDAKQAVARDMGVLGLPITVILNREGQEIARLRGDAEWDSDSAKAILTTLISDGAS